VRAETVDLGDRVGVLRPIATAAPCLQCHGPSDSVSPETAAFLSTAYPGDRAVGFAEGDLRGFFWAEAPLARPAGPPAAAAPPAPADRKARKEGERLLGEANPRCTMCHFVDGKGNRSGSGPQLDGVGTRLSRDEIASWIRTPREMALRRGSTRKPAMVPYPEFSDEELDALVAYLVSLEAKPPGK
jgi:mono/diheme cytochrome c family protein